MAVSKEHLFRAGARSLRRITTYTDDIYACPLCLTIFGESSLENGRLTLEHVPPASIGGNGIVLTCHSCNSQAGYSIEAELHRYQEVVRFAESLAGDGDFSGRVRLEMSGVTTNVEANFEGGKLTMSLPNEINNPRSLHGQFDQLDEMVDTDTWDGYQFRVTPVMKFKPRLADLSYLKAAYLAAFASLGYTYILNDRLQPVRRQIATPDDKIVSLYMVRMSTDHEEAHKMIAVEHPFKAVAVQFGRRLVFLPPVEPSESFYDNLPKFIQDGAVAGKLTGSEWPFPTALDLQLDHADAN